MVQPVVDADGVKRLFTRVYYNQPNKERPGVQGAVGILDTGAWVYFPKGQEITHREREKVHRILQGADDSGLAGSRFDAWCTAMDAKARDEVEAQAKNPKRRAIIIVECEDFPRSMLVFQDTGDEVTERGDVDAWYSADSPVGALALQVFADRHRYRTDKAYREAQALPQTMAAARRQRTIDNLRRGREAKAEARAARLETVEPKG